MGGGHLNVRGIGVLAVIVVVVRQEVGWDERAEDGGDENMNDGDVLDWEAVYESFVRVRIAELTL